ncbi:hypothetical protein [Helicobacter cetorum]|uniref:hypothetical protein n=1 Tax=Helicobacter cetorum TaxID=138563 RepID=UPI000CF037A6|nr:hypothetical protein [Helicobacter cetorum]
MQIYNKFLMVCLLLFSLLNLVELLLISYSAYKMEKLEDTMIENLNEVKTIIKQSNDHLKCEQGLR